MSPAIEWLESLDPEAHAAHFGRVVSMDGGGLFSLKDDHEKAFGRCSRCADSPPVVIVE